MSSSKHEIHGAEVVESEGLSDWEWHDDALHARFETGDFATGLALVNRIGESAEAMDHHPDLDLRYGHVDVVSRSHDAGGVTDRDLRLARVVSEHAAGRGIRAAAPGWRDARPGG